MTFQDIILELQRYWASQGCAVVQPWDVEKGAGTFNASTYLRSLGPEPWDTAYVEPSRRPTDGRYGENPNRLERHHQFQVILKPSPKNVQELYLGSLRAIGIDPMEHDIRFVEDNWESPTLGAWGLGWEVWCDGMEITQFTYFQQCGGFDLNPICVELTYGLERIAMYVQDVENVYDVKWVDDLTYGDVRHPDEQQWSAHNFDHADIELHLRWFDELKDECLRLCDAGLPIPAYDYCLRCSHVFNILDARGAIGVTERQAYILRVRELSKRCAESYMEHREQLGFPLLRRKKSAADSDIQVPELLLEGDQAGQGAFLLEIGTEEIPAKMAKKAASSLLSLIQEQLTAWGLKAQGVHADCTPRRLVVGFDQLPLRQEDSVETVKGPPTRIAYDENGELTRAGQAFHSKIAEGDELYREDTDKGEYLMVRRRQSGRPTAELLADVLPAMIAKIHWPKPMRWGYEPTPFVRPVHWILCALNGALVPFKFADVVSGLESRGHRFHAPDVFTATRWTELEEALEERRVILSSDRRRDMIREQVATLAKQVDGIPVEDPALLDEVTHLVEWPVPLLASFEPELLELPRQAVVTPMRVHQRYFPIEDKNGQLLPNFAVIANTEVIDAGVVAQGNARVLRARLADARFFYENDLKTPLESFLPQLETRIWLKKLGSVRKKVDRIVALVGAMGGSSDACRAALLAKADLASEMVGEFAKLQGEMGRVYATAQGESQEVADAIFEHYLPRFAGDKLPATAAGTLVALADRFDSIVGCYGIGLKPTGSKDPYALRRQALGIINILKDSAHDIPLSIATWLDGAIAGYGDQIDANCRNDILEFFAERTRFLLRETLPSDVVDAVVAAGAVEPREVYNKIDTFVTLRDKGSLEPILVTFKRVANITREVPIGAGYDASVLEEAAEVALSEHFKSMTDSDSAADQLAGVRPVVDTFFDEILVMSDDSQLKDARLGLLGAIRDYFSSFADFTRIQDRK